MQAPACPLAQVWGNVRVEPVTPVGFLDAGGQEIPSRSGPGTPPHAHFTAEVTEAR